MFKRGCWLLGRGWLLFNRSLLLYQIVEVLSHQWLVVAVWLFIIAVMMVVWDSVQVVGIIHKLLAVCRTDAEGSQDGQSHFKIIIIHIS